MSNVVKVNEGNFDAIVLKSQIPVLIDVGASWCKPCKKFKPILEKFAENNKGRVLCVYVDIDESSDLMDIWGITKVPYLMFFNNGKIVRKNSGGLDGTRLDEFTTV